MRRHVASFFNVGQAYDHKNLDNPKKSFIRILKILIPG